MRKKIQYHCIHLEEKTPEALLFCVYTVVSAPCAPLLHDSVVHHKTYKYLVLDPKGWPLTDTVSPAGFEGHNHPCIAPIGMFALTAITKLLVIEKLDHFSEDRSAWYFASPSQLSCTPSYLKAAGRRQAQQQSWTRYLDLNSTLLTFTPFLANPQSRQTFLASAWRKTTYTSPKTCD